MIAAESTSSERAHWPDIARRWHLVGPPLRPGAEDVAFYTKAIERWSQDHGAPRALILGVTPELCALPWPRGSDVFAIDRTRDMIAALWQGPTGAVCCADWTDMPLERSARDIAVCDGGLQLLSHPEGQARLVDNLRFVLAPGGLCIFRIFQPPRPSEDIRDLQKAIRQGEVADVNILKLRAAMALQADKCHGVRLGDVWDAIHQAAPDLRQLAARLGKPAEPFLAIETYRDCPTRYFFLTVAETCRIFARGFYLDSIGVPHYELGRRCPTLVFRRDGTR